MYAQHKYILQANKYFLMDKCFNKFKDIINTKTLDILFKIMRKKSVCLWTFYCFIFHKKAF